MIRKLFYCKSNALSYFQSQHYSNLILKEIPHYMKYYFIFKYIGVLIFVISIKINIIENWEFLLWWLHMRQRERIYWIRHWEVVSFLFKRKNISSTWSRTIPINVGCGRIALPPTIHPSDTSSSYWARHWIEHAPSIVFVCGEMVRSDNASVHDDV